MGVACAASAAYVAQMTQSPQERAGEHNEPAREHDERARAHRARQEAERREVLASLRGLSERDTFATSALARAARRASDHFAAADAAGEDRIELWGRRVGRALSLAGFVALAIYLYLTHFR